MVLHDLLHLEAQRGGPHLALGVARLVEAGQRQLVGVERQGPVALARLHHLGAALGRAPAEHDQVEEGVRAQPICAVDRDAGRLADRHQARHGGLGPGSVRAVRLGHHLAGIDRRDAAHVVVHRGQHRHGLLGDVDPGEDPRGLGDAGQALGDHLRVEVLDVQVDVVLLGTDAAALADFQRHGPADHVAAGQVLGAGRVALHEALALGVGQVAALAAHALGDQAAGREDAGRVELDELHVLERQARAQHHGVAVAGLGVGAGAGEVGPAVAAGRQDRVVRRETVDRAVVEVPGDHAAALAVLHHEVEGEVLDEELGAVLQALLVERVQHGVAGAVGRGAGAVGDALAKAGGHPAEGALVDLALGRAAERHAVVLELDDRGDRLAGHVLDRVLVAQPVGALDRVVHVPAPVVLAHVAERGRDAALGRHGVAAGREDLADAGGLEAGLGQTQGRAQAGAAGADHDDVVGMVDDFVGGRGHVATP